MPHATDGKTNSGYENKMQIYRMNNMKLWNEGNLLWSPREKESSNLYTLTFSSDISFSIYIVLLVKNNTFSISNTLVN
jgi:hypothetical protein